MRRVSTARSTNEERQRAEIGKAVDYSPDTNPSVRVIAKTFGGFVRERELFPSTTEQPRQLVTPEQLKEREE